MNNMIFLFIMIGSVFISSISQVLLKKSAQKQYTNIINEYLNPWVIGAYMLFFSSTVCTVFALKYVPLSFAPAIESCGYIFVALLSQLFLKENMSSKQKKGMFFIICGVLMVATGFV